ncbi:reverse transcriptase domain protein [Colletotrichum tabaci]|uniref:RNA-directed DNA polymerase n=1 Tax=Colletotrichum tabaci TaxID=1209068 RepID=A0AAV9TL99_9PEZI
MAPVTTPTSSSVGSKGKTPATPKNLDEEMKDAENSDDELNFTKKVYDTLQRRIRKNDSDIAQMQAMVNETIAKLEAKNEEAGKLGQEVRTLRAAASIISTPVDGREKLKLNSPSAYDGTSGQLKGFLIQIRTYQTFHAANFGSETERVIHAATFLKGKALAWFEPFMEEFLQNNGDTNACSTETRDIFSSMTGFEHALQTLFQDPDEKRQAERDLANLRQNKSASHYAAEFRRLAARLDITNESRIFMFYQGLKEEVKDEIVKLDAPTDFLQYVALAIRIDTRLYERRKEKSENRRPQANVGKRYVPQGPRQPNNYNSNWRNNQQRNNGPSTAYGHHAGPMDVSVAHKNKPTTRRDPRSGVCFNCEKPGHIARECRQPKRLQNRPLPEDTKKANIAKKEVPHEQLSWTACYNDGCPTHQDGKEQAGWYPREPKNKTVAVSRKSKHGDVQIMEKRNQQLITKLIQARDTAQAQLSSPNMPETLQAIKARLQQRIQAQGDYQRQLALEEDLAGSVQEEIGLTSRLTKIVAVGKKQAKPSFSQPRLGIRERTPQEAIEVLGERTSSDYTSDSGESLDEFLPPSKMERRAAEQLLELRQTRSSTRSKSPNLKIKQEMRQRLRNLDPYDRTKLQEYEIDEGNDIDSDEPLASQTYLDNSRTQINQRPNVDKTHNNQEIRFYGTEDVDVNNRPEVRIQEKPLFGDDKLLELTHKRHYRIFRADCIYDECKTHLRSKEEYAFYPRRQGREPIPRAYQDSELNTWKVKEYLTKWLCFQPSPKHPMPCVNHITKHCLENADQGKELQQEVEKLGTPTAKGPQTATQHKKSLCAATREDDRHLFLEAIIDGQPTQVMIDSGAQANFMSPRLINQRQIAWRLKDEPYALQNVEGETVEYDGGIISKETAQLSMVIHGRQEQLVFDITKIGQLDVILGVPWLRKHDPDISWKANQLRWRDSATEARCMPQPPGEHRRQRYVAYVKRIEPMKDERFESFINDQREEERLSPIPAEYRSYKKLFAEELETGLPEHGPWDHEIPIKEGEHPKFHKLYGLNENQREELDKYIDENLRKGYIRPSTSPAGYPILFVPKKNGKLRLCVDYRQLNDITIKNSYPLPLITELRDLLYGAKWFTALDLKGAYNLIRIKEGEEWKTCFRTRRGNYEYLVMPFGLTNAPASFQTMINHVLREYLDVFVVVYLDDILIFSPTLEIHKEHVHKVLQKLQEAKLLVEPEKSVFHSQRVDYLGFTITPGEIRMDDKKIAAVKDWPRPQNVKDIQSFLGFVNFYRRFLKGYSGKINPLIKLTRKDTTFEWTNEQDKAFEDIKQQVLSEPVLMIPDPRKPFELETDASDYAIGGQLGQRDEEGRLHPCGFFSKKLSGPELNYQIHDKELMAIIEAFREWKPQLSGTKHEVKVYTDHKNLAHFTTSKALNKRQIRWSEFLSEFNFRIIYVKGTENGRADALSRRPDHETPVPDETLVILKQDDKGDLVPAQKLIMIGTRVNTSTTGRMTPEQIREIHSARAHGHQGVTKTFKRIRQHYDKRVTRAEVASAIKDCEMCKKSKNSPHKPYGQLQPLPIPPEAWHSISLDFIVKLPKSREPLTKTWYDSILVIVDRLTKYAYFIPYLESSTAEDLAYTFLKYIISNHGLPKEIVSDRDKLFTSKFWKSLISQLGADHKLSTAFHPQTDGQTERINQILEQYLRCYVNYDQDNWVPLLPMAQFAYNSAIGESTLHSPFYLNYGFQPTAYGQPRQGPRALKAVADYNKLRELQENISNDLEFVRARMKKYSDPSRMTGPSFEEGDSAYLIRRNIKTKRPSDKLDYKKLGPFEITQKISDVNFKLKLPDTMKVHPVFHIALLEPAPRGSHTEDCIIVETHEPEYEVERIIDHRNENGHDEYLIKWKGYGHEDNSWEPVKNLQHSQQALQQYHKKDSRDLAPQNLTPHPENSSRTPRQHPRKRDPAQL